MDVPAETTNDAPCLACKLIGPEFAARKEAIARDLFAMYRKYAEGKGWKMEILDASPTEQGGFKEIMLAFEGDSKVVWY